MTDWKSAVIRVGDGRGFVIEGQYDSRYVITAAHCLARLPILHGEPGWGGFDTTYQNLLAPLGCAPSVWAECLFADPVGDIAVLGQPDTQALGEQADAYDALLEPVPPLKIATPGEEGWLLSLDGGWFRCAVQMIRNPILVLTAMEGNFVGGMSGSPIVSAEGAAIGVACLGAEDGAGHQTEPVGPNPSLLGNLPGWLLEECQRQPA
jgi:hypothetical protein